MSNKENTPKNAPIEMPKVVKRLTTYALCEHKDEAVTRFLEDEKSVAVSIKKQPDGKYVLEMLSEVD